MLLPLSWSLINSWFSLHPFLSALPVHPVHSPPQKSLSSPFSYPRWMSCLSPDGQEQSRPGADGRILFAYIHWSRWRSGARKEEGRGSSKDRYPLFVSGYSLPSDFHLLDRRFRYETDALIPSLYLSSIVDDFHVYIALGVALPHIFFILPNVSPLHNTPAPALLCALLRLLSEHGHVMDKQPPTYHCLHMSFSFLTDGLFILASLSCTKMMGPGKTRGP